MFDPIISLCITVHHELKELNLSSNKLTLLDNKPFEGLTKLTELYLSWNNLTSLDNKPFEGLTSLRALCLFDNKLENYLKD